MSSRREFIKNSIMFTSMFPFLEWANPTLTDDFLTRAQSNAKLGLQASTQDEDFWGWVKEQYTVSPNLMNLNNGGVSPQPKCVQDAHIKYYQYCNEAPSYYMWRILDQGREPLREKLADLAGCSKEEIAINRNSTEGLNTIIFGLDLKEGDEIVLSKQDYPNMVNAWKQREKRDKVKLVWIDLPLPSDNADELANTYIKAFTNKTKVVHITHMINWTGQIIPAKKIANEAKKRGIYSILDSAHTFAHIDFLFPDTECDFSATSLHKWLGAPFGSGMMYLKKDNIQKIWPLLSSSLKDDDIRKFETIGTRSFASEMAIGTAIDFHNIIGIKRKENRLRYLKDYWTNKAKGIPKVKIHTPANPQFSCALAMFSIENKKPQEIEQKLLDKYKIHTTVIEWENLHGVRVTPHLYTTIKDLDKLVHAITDISKDA